MTTLFSGEFVAATESLAAVREAVREACRKAGCDEECGGQIVLAVNEACMNIIQHAYAFAPDATFRLCLQHADGILTAQLLDNGKPATLADLRPRELDDVRPGGLGVHFMRATMDAVDLLPPPAGFTNLLQLSKRIG